MFKKYKEKFIGDREFYANLIRLIIPMIVQQGITSFVSLLDNVMVGRLGTESMSGVAIVNQLLFVFNLTIFGGLAGASIFGAQFYGKGDHKGVRYALRFKLIFSVLMAVIAITAPFIPLIYNTTPEVQRLTTELLLVAGAALPIQAFAHVTYFTIRSGGKTFITFLFDCVFTWLIPLPIAFFCSRYTALSIIGIYALVQFADIIKVIIGSILLRSGIWANNVVSDVD